MGSMNRSQNHDWRNMPELAAALMSGKLVDEFDMNWAKRESERRDKALADVLVELELATPQAIQSCVDSLRRVGRLHSEG